MSSNKTRKIIIICLCMMLVAIILVFAMNKLSHSRTNSTNTKASAPQLGAGKAVLTVETTQPTQQNLPLKIRINGTISAWQEAQVGAEIGGLRISQVLADIGDEVKRGQLLVALNDETIIAALHKQQATVAANKASLAEAKSNADRAREIKDSGAISTQQINQYLIAEETAKANLAASQAELENQQIQLKHTRIVAADDGIISSRSANLGNVVSTGSELFKLIRQARIEWRAEVNAEQLSHIHKGQKVNLALPNGKEIIGYVRSTAPTLDANTRNALVYVDIAKHAAPPGMYAQGEIETGHQPALLVPQATVIMRDGRSYVFEVGANQHVIQHAITTGRRTGDLVEITSNFTGNDATGAGVTINTKLVATGGAFLNDGDIVSVTNTQKAAK